MLKRGINVLQIQSNLSDLPEGASVEFKYEFVKSLYNVHGVSYTFGYTAIMGI